MKIITKSQLQVRAETAAQIFHSARKPIVLEFAGVPKAGKTSTLNALQSFLKRCGFRVEIVAEKAAVCPIRDKHHFNFNVWTACTTLAQILEKTQNPPGPSDPDILILDRGLFDAVCWLQLMERLERIRPGERGILEKFLMVDDWRRRISAVFVMTAKPSDAMAREKGLLPVKGSKGRGSIMNEPVLEQMLQTTTETAIRLKNDFRIYHINTSEIQHKEPQRRVAEIVAGYTLDVIEDHLREEILCLPKKSLFKSREIPRFFSEKEASDIAKKFATEGKFGVREEVEQNADLIQALPVVIIRKKNGDVLRLKRRERDSNNPLNEKTVIWAGGHARKEDKANGNTLIHCALRELQEELRLSLEAHELKLRGAIYSDENPSSAKHIAIVYEWRAETDDVAVALSSAEFFERRGTSLSGTFVPVSELAEDVEQEKITEQWTVEIVREIVAKGQYKFSQRLL